MNQRSTIGSITNSAKVPSGTAMAAAMYIGSTSGQVQSANARTVNGAAPSVSMMQQRHRGDARAIHRGDQRNVDLRRAEAGKAAHRAGQHGNRQRDPEARVGDRGGKERVFGKIDQWLARARFS